MRDEADRSEEQEAPARRAVSPDGLAFIKAHEGFHQKAVKLEDGRWLLGYSAVEPDAEGREITLAEAEERLRRDLEPIEAAINALVFAPLSRGQFDALASLGFSIGEQALRGCGMAEALNDGRPIDAAAVFDAWRDGPVGDALKPIDALVRRRAAEKAMFLTLDSGPVAASSALLRARSAAQAARTAPRAAPASTIDQLVQARGRTTPDPQLLERLSRILPEPQPAADGARSDGARPGGGRGSTTTMTRMRPPSPYPPAPYPLRRGMSSPGPVRTATAAGAQALRFDPGLSFTGASWREQWPWILGGAGLAVVAVGVVNLRALAVLPDGGPAEVVWAIAAIGGALALAAGGYNALRRRPPSDE
jgi:lysozyme